MRKICLALPDTVETEKWGKPHFCVKGKIFAGCGEEDGQFTVGFKLAKAHAARMVAEHDRCRPSKYVGKHGWVTLSIAAKTDWALVRDGVQESYDLIAGKRR